MFNYAIISLNMHNFTFIFGR